MASRIFKMLFSDSCVEPLIRLAQPHQKKRGPKTPDDIRISTSYLLFRRFDFVSGRREFEESDHLPASGRLRWESPACSGTPGPLSDSVI